FQIILDRHHGAIDARTTVCSDHASWRGRSLSGAAHMSTTDDLRAKAADQTVPDATQSEDRSAADEDPESAGEILRGNTMLVLVVGLVVLLGVFALLIAI